MTGEPAVRAVLAATLTHGSEHVLGGRLDTRSYDINIANPAVLLFPDASAKGAAIGHVADVNYAGDKLTLVFHVRSNREPAAELIQAIDTGMAPGVDLRIAGGVHRPGHPPQRPRLLAVVLDYLNVWAGADLRILDRHGALSQRDTAAHRRIATRAATTSRLLAPFAIRPVVDLSPIPTPWR